MFTVTVEHKINGLSVLGCTGGGGGGSREEVA
jgi:hypothetical protein